MNIFRNKFILYSLSIENFCSFQAASQGAGTPGAVAFSSGTGAGGGYGGGYSGPGAGFEVPTGGASGSQSYEGSYGAGETPNVFARGGFGGDNGAALASAAFGPGGVHQTAAVYPENAVRFVCCNDKKIKLSILLSDLKHKLHNAKRVSHKLLSWK